MSHMAPPGEAPPSPASSDTRRRRARLAAVKLLYAHEIHGGRRAFAKLREDVLDYWRDELGEGADVLKAVDVPFFDLLAMGCIERKEGLDEMIRRYLAENWKFSRIELVMRDILRLGVFEIALLKEVSVATIANEYIEIAKAYFGESESAFVNALLDNVARALRPEEAAAQGPPPEPVP
jgi:N utilization substance protein B